MKTKKQIIQSAVSPSVLNGVMEKVKAKFMPLVRGYLNPGPDDEALFRKAARAGADAIRAVLMEGEGTTPAKKHVLEVIFGEAAAEYSGEHGFASAKRLLKQDGIEGEYARYAFDTEADRDLACRILSDSDGWMGADWHKAGRSQAATPHPANGGTIRVATLIEEDDGNVFTQIYTGTAPEVRDAVLGHLKTETNERGIEILFDEEEILKEILDGNQVTGPLRLTVRDNDYDNFYLATHIIENR